MENFKQAKKVESIIAGCMLFFVTVVVVAVISFVSLGKARRKSAEYDDMIASLTKQEQQLQNDIYNLKNNPEYLQELAINNYGMIKEGDTLYIFNYNKK